jgi:hypothetical protein
LGLTLGDVLWRLLSHSQGLVAAAVGALIVLAIGFARVALNVHHPSDVLGAGIPVLRGVRMGGAAVGVEAGCGPPGCPEIGFGLA